MGMFERYTDQAKRAVFFAHMEALHRNEPSISAADLLIGLTWEESARACQISVLKDHAVELRALLGIPHLPSTAFPYRRKRDIPLADDAKKTLAYAAMEANRSWQYWIDTDYLLSAMLRFRNPAGDALHSIGFDLTSVRTASRDSRLACPSAPLPKWQIVKEWLREHRVGAATLAVLLLIFAYLKLYG